MSDYRYQIVDHNGIASLHVMIDQDMTDLVNGIASTYIPIDDIDASIKRHRKEQKTMGGKPSKGTPADKRLAANKPEAKSAQTKQPAKPFPGAAPPFKKGSGKS